MAGPLDDPFWVHHLDPASLRRTWRRGSAAVVETLRPVARRTAVVVIGLGPADDLAPLLAQAAEESATPDRVMVAGDGAVLPPAWRPAAPRSWHWMLSATPPPPPAHPIDPEPSPGAVDAVLDAAMPESHARPGTPGVECWLGVTAEPGGRVLGVGAVARQPDGTGNLRGVAVLGPYARQGLGASLSAALTLRAQAGASGVATLGVYVDNTRAVAMYERLGYATRHTFYSGELPARSSVRSMTSAGAPSA